MAGSEAGSHGAQGGAPRGSPAASGMSDSPPTATTDAASPEPTGYAAGVPPGRAATVSSVIATASGRIVMQLTVARASRADASHLSCPCGFRPPRLACRLQFPITALGAP